MENNPDNIAKLEALLFIHGEPMDKKKIKSVLNFTDEDLAAATAGLKEHLAGETSGLALLQNGDKLQLITKPAFGEVLSEFIKDELTADLTPAALEALSLILYLGPIHRSRLDYLRGVNSSFIVRSLMLRGLVERYPDPARPYTFLYQASAAALRHLGIGSVTELAEYEKFHELSALHQESAENLSS